MAPGTLRPALARYLALAPLLMLLLAGCTEEALRQVVTFLLIIVLIYGAVFAALLVVLIVNIVKMLRGTPSMGWGITACVCGGLTGLSQLGSVVTGHASPSALSGFALAGGLLWVGIKNVLEVRRRAALKTGTPSDPPFA